MTLGLLEGIPHDRWTWQAFEGQNHAAWIGLHLLISDDWGPVGLGHPETRWVDRWQALLDGGPDPDPARWPSPASILEMMAQGHERYLACLSPLSDEDLSHPTRGALAEYAPVMGTLVDSHIWHEGFHGGQLSVIRKALRLPPVFG